MTTPTSDIDEASPRIAGKHELVEYLEAGSKPATDWRIGTEHEKFGFIRDGLRPLPYDGEASVLAMLEGLRDRFGWEPIREGKYLIGLQRNGASVSLEPGGQFELSGAPLETIHQTCTEVGRHLDEVRQIADPLGVAFIGLGASPIWSLAETPVMPKGRYKIMTAYMDKVGRLGRQMMFRTCTVQTNLDFGSEADMVKKFRVSLALQPLGTALFANSPFMEGRPNGFLSYRSQIWTDTDPDRTGMLPFVFEDGFGFEQYVDYALDVPMYFVRRGGQYLDASGLSFRDFMAGKLDILPGERPAMDDFADHLSTIFPEVRLKRFLEMRGSDAGPWSHLCAFSAFWTGLLYCPVCLDAAWDLVKGWTAAEREAMRQSVRTLGLKTPIPGGRTLQDLAVDVLELARTGLKNRANLGPSGDDETGYLHELDAIARSGKTPAERLLERYYGEWNRDVRHVFAEQAY
ncbi:MAG TPA: glutamate--cysteine ligase [Hyphomonas sp.]|nr:glutamate--cysteine ligase [Hyphomonas sp.]MCA8903856.1 glutamate--cysteine ligase [Hyphomonas sp.]MCB9960710.1 glutamate--cysteine ligase [Hyphomonas sp.]MCB9971941.1 glutamate--cysteine ligase [Hyphomonas sp.]HPE48564.1 glutamate--cysteine ligase [Hyphomonas sp.]